MRKAPHIVVVFSKDGVVATRAFTRYDEARKLARDVTKNSYNHSLFAMVTDEKTAEKYNHPGLN